MSRTRQVLIGLAIVAVLGAAATLTDPNRAELMARFKSA